MSSTHHILILPSPGMGHLTPLTKLSTTLLTRHNISSTFLIPSDVPELSKPQQALLSSVNHILLPVVNLEDLPSSVKVETRISLTITRSLPSIREAVKSLIAEYRTKKIVAFVFDLFGTDGFDVAKEFSIPSYIFYPSTATALSFFLYLPKLDQMVSCEYRDVGEKIRVPGCVPMNGYDLLDPVQDRKNDAYKWLIHHAKRYRMAEGIIVNSFKELECKAIEALQAKGNDDDDDVKPCVYPVGPLIHTGSKVEENNNDDDDEFLCLRWLDEQPSSSVLYVSFGSGGTLCHEQMIELALGLEMSEQRFLWVVRCPSDTSSATFFGIRDSKDPLTYLPQGFVERTRGRGLVVPSWAPQTRVLAHGSVCAFLTHCGWNSTLESVVYGVPLIAWPLYAEQKMNAVMLVEEIKVALRPKVGENGLVGRIEIVKVVKGLMEGEEGKRVRSRMRDLKDDAARVLGENGSSTKMLSELAKKWKGVP